MRTFFKVIILLLTTSLCKAQSVVYYPFNSQLGISTNPNKVVWLDAKIQMNSFTSSLSTELSPEFNLNKNPLATYYVGAGAKFNFLSAAFEDKSPLDGYFLNFGVRSAPFAKYPGVQIAFELSPYANKDFDLGAFRANLGIGYNFSHKKK